MAEKCIRVTNEDGDEVFLCADADGAIIKMTGIGTLTIPQRDAADFARIILEAQRRFDSEDE